MRVNLRTNTIGLEYKTTQSSPHSPSSLPGGLHRRYNALTVLLATPYGTAEVLKHATRNLYKHRPWSISLSRISKLKWFCCCTGPGGAPLLLRANYESYGHFIPWSSGVDVESATCKFKLNVYSIFLIPMHHRMQHVIYPSFLSYIAHLSRFYLHEA